MKGVDGKVVVKVEAKKGEGECPLIHARRKACVCGLTRIDISTLSSQLDSPHLILLTGTRAAVESPEKRQEQEAPFDSSSASSASSTSTRRHRSSTTRGHQSTSTTGPQNKTLLTDGPLLERAQFLTTPIITAVLISFLIFIPIVMFGINALVGISVPPRMMEISKGMAINKDKKDQ
jgi:hypothetical protein